MIEIYSLIDITKTNIQRNNRAQGSSLSQKEWDFKRNQERNWQTVIQLLGLRFQPETITAPVRLDNQRPASLGFGWMYGPLDDITVWKCRCRYEQDVDLWLIRGDFDNIPIVTGLDESISFPLSCFSSIGDNLNIVLTELS
jgi:hypothetical protein